MRSRANKACQTASAAMRQVLKKANPLACCFNAKAQVVESDDEEHIQKLSKSKSKKRSPPAKEDNCMEKCGSDVSSPRVSNDSTLSRDTMMTTISTTVSNGDTCGVALPAEHAETVAPLRAAKLDIVMNGKTMQYVDSLISKELPMRQACNCQAATSPGETGDRTEPVADVTVLTNTMGDKDDSPGDMQPKEHPAVLDYETLPDEETEAAEFPAGHTTAAADVTPTTVPIMATELSSELIAVATEAEPKAVLGAVTAAAHTTVVGIAALPDYETEAAQLTADLPAVETDGKAPTELPSMAMETAAASIEPAAVAAGVSRTATVAELPVETELPVEMTTMVIDVAPKALLKVEEIQTLINQTGMSVEEPREACNVKAATNPKQLKGITKSIAAPVSSVTGQKMSKTLTMNCDETVANNQPASFLPDDATERLRVRDIAGFRVLSELRDLLWQKNKSKATSHYEPLDSFMHLLTSQHLRTNSMDRLARAILLKKMYEGGVAVDHPVSALVLKKWLEKGAYGLQEQERELLNMVYCELVQPGGAGPSNGPARQGSGLSPHVLRGMSEAQQIKLAMAESLKYSGRW